MIEIRGLSKRFGKKVVLDGLDLDVPKGKNTVVIGGSGTGKSVLIKCVVGLLRSDAGSIRVDGEAAEAVEVGGDSIGKIGCPDGFADITITTVHFNHAAGRFFRPGGTRDDGRISKHGHMFHLADECLPINVWQSQIDHEQIRSLFVRQL